MLMPADILKLLHTNGEEKKGYILKRLSETLADRYDEDALGKIKIRYGAEVLRNELIKFVILSAIYLFIGRFTLLIFAAGILFPVRVFSGGMHMHSNISCFVFSFIFFGLSVCILPDLSISFKAALIMMAGALLIIAFCSPIATQNKPITTRKRYTDFKIRSILLSCIVSVLLLFLHAQGIDLLFRIGLWTLSLQSLQLLAAKTYHILSGKGDENDGYLQKNK